MRYIRYMRSVALFVHLLYSSPPVCVFRLSIPPVHAFLELQDTGTLGHQDNWWGIGANLPQLSCDFFLSEEKRFDGEKNGKNKMEKGKWNGMMKIAVPYC